MRSTPFLALAVLALVAACDVPAEFAAPVSAPGSATHDERLIGKWHVAEPDDDGVSMLTIREGDDGMLEAAFGYLAVSPGENGGAGIGWAIRDAYPSAIDGVTYYNSRMIDGGFIEKDVGAEPKSELSPYSPPHPELGYWIVSATFESDDRMTLGILSDNVPNKRELPGREVDCGEDCEFELVEITSEELTALIRSVPHDELFSIRIPFARFGTPAAVVD